MSTIRQDDNIGAAIHADDRSEQESAPRYHLVVIPESEARAAWRAYCAVVAGASREGFTRNYAGEFRTLAGYAWHALYICHRLPDNLSMCFDYEAYGKKLVTAGDILAVPDLARGMLFVFRKY